jgi:Ca-activated chloride channel family protein
MRSRTLFAATAVTLVLAGCAGQSGPELASADTDYRGAQEAPPPPPPPTPPPSRASSEGQQVVVTGQRNARREYESNSPVVTIGQDLLASPSAPAQGNLTKQAKPESRYGFISVPPVYVATDPGNERYDGEEVSPVKVAAAEPISTFSVDVDTGAYANARRFLTGGALPPKDAVRTEELINYFRYDYPRPESRGAPFTVTTDVAVSPWNPETRLLRIGLRGYDLPRAARPPANLVFLVDVSGSMSSADKLPLVKAALSQLAGNLSPRDKVSIVVYAGAAGLVLDPTSDTRKIRAALESLNAGGSTAGGAGIQLAYRVARDSFIEGGVNRVVLATDGDFNVGVTDQDALIELIEKERDSGITLTALGFGTGNLNDAMMEQVADHGNGNYAYIDSALEAEKVLSDEMQSTLFTIAKDVKIQVEFNPAQVAQYRLIGYENRALRNEDFNNDKVDAGDIGAGHQVTAIYEIVPAGAKGWVDPLRYGGATVEGEARSEELAFVKLRYKLPDGATSKLIERAVPTRLFANATLPRGDMAFATAVAAYGQLLRGDPLLGNFGYAQVVDLAGRQSDFWRQEFVRLADLAGGLDKIDSGG